MVHVPLHYQERTPNTHSQVYSQLRWMTLPACLIIRSPVHSHDTPKYTPSTLQSKPPSHSQVHSQMQSMVHSQPTSLYALNYTLKWEKISNLTSLLHPRILLHACFRDLLHCRHWEVEGWLCMAGGGWPSGEIEALEGREPIINTPLHLLRHSKRNL